MDVMADFTLDSIENEDHLSEHIAEIAKIVDKAGLEFEIGGAGTTILGELETVLECIAECHEMLGEDGRRVKSVINLDVREDWPPGSIELQAEKVRKQVTGAEMV